MSSLETNFKNARPKPRPRLPKQVRDRKIGFETKNQYRDRFSSKNIQLLHELLYVFQINIFVSA